METFPTWSDGLKIGIEVVDDQHKVFLEIIEDLRQATAEGRLEEEIGPIFEKLEGYVRYHFAFEEKLFLDFGYEHTDEHIAEHNHLADKVTMMKDDFEKDGIKIAPDLSLFLANWLIGHIKGSDAQYVRCFHEHGVK